jgi:serine/threonine protein kinase
MSYSAIDVLGHGSFGIVYSAVNNQNQLVAVKCKLILSNFVEMEKSSILFRGEFEALYSLNHFNIVK